MRRLPKIFALYFLSAATLLSPFSFVAVAQNNLVTPPPPMAKKIPKETNIHGVTLVDPYFWLREKNNPEVKAYLEAENAYTETVMRPTEALQATLYKEMIGHIKETDANVPYHIARGTPPA